jgi:hypothetical protein
MNIKILAGTAILVIAFTYGCSGNYGKLKTQSEKETKTTQQELIENWSNYNIRYNSVVIVFDQKNDDKKILVDNYWDTVKDQETWTQLVNGTKTLPNRSINQVWGNEIRELWIPDNQFYGYVIYQPRELVSAQIVDENMVRLIHNYAVYGGP